MFVRASPTPVHRQFDLFRVHYNNVASPSRLLHDPLAHDSTTMTSLFTRGHASTSSRPMEDFYEIERQAEVCTVAESATSATTTVYGIGALSGKAIQSLGEAAIRGAEHILTKAKMRSIESILKHKDPANWPLSVMADLLELQRYGYLNCAFQI